MEAKLQSLLERIKQDGVDKGQAVANSLISDAEAEAAEILAQAKREAAEIRQRAESQAEELKRNVTSELQLSANQAIGALKQAITSLITTQAVEAPNREAFQDKDFLKGIISSMLENWQKSGQASALYLSPEQESELYSYFTQRAEEDLRQGLTVKPVPKLSRGFRIGPADGSFLVSFTEEDFHTFFVDFLRPRTKALLYGEAEASKNGLDG